MSLSHLLLVMIITVERPHEPIILEKMHAFSLLIHVIEDEFALDQHLLFF